MFIQKKIGIYYLFSEFSLFPKQVLVKTKLRLDRIKIIYVKDRQRTKSSENFGWKTVSVCDEIVCDVLWEGEENRKRDSDKNLTCY